MKRFFIAIILTIFLVTPCLANELYFTIPRAFIEDASEEVLNELSSHYEAIYKIFNKSCKTVDSKIVGEAPDKIVAVMFCIEQIEEKGL